MTTPKARRAWGKIRRLPSGLYQASYTGPDRRRHSAPGTFELKLNAEFWLSDEHRLIETGAWISPAARKAAAAVKGVTLATYAAEWIEQRNVKPRTRIGYEGLLRLHIKDQIGAVPLAMLTPQHVRSWYHGLGTDHPRRNTHAYGLLHAICSTAVKDQILAANPCQIERAMDSPRKREPIILTPGEVATLAETITPPKMKAFILVSAWCGLRYGEVVELRRKDIAPDGSVIGVSRAVTHRGQCRIDTTKSGRARTVVTPPHIRAVLVEHLAQHVGDDPKALVFPAVTGCHLNDRVARTYLEPALKSIGRESVRIHDLRHFAGTQAARVGNLPETMAYLGHSTPRASLRYQAIVSGRAAEMADQLSRLATGAEPENT
jgi:integrase